MRNLKWMVCWLVLAPVLAMAGSAASSHRLKAAGVAWTNDQANSTWVPVALLWKFDAATNATIRVERISQGSTFLVAATSISNATSAVWVSEAEYPFALGDVLMVVSSATNGVVQVIRKGE